MDSLVAILNLIKLRCSAYITIQKYCLFPSSSVTDVYFGIMEGGESMFFDNVGRYFITSFDQLVHIMPLHGM